MDPSTLAARLRAIVKGPIRLKPDPTNELPTSAAVGSGLSRIGTDVSQVLGGDWCRRDGLSCFVVERRHGPETVYGRDRLAAIAARLAGAAADAPLVMGGAPARPPFVFFDLETTGLSGGAGTCAFLVGCGAFDEDGAFVTRQFILLCHTDERALLQIVGAELAQAGALVTFNGKSFDAPLIETRYLFHRLEWTGAALPHLDVLHPARRFWSDGGALETPCSLQALESQVLGARRTSDVPGSEIPARYFQFVRTGDARPLVAVLEHNRLDLLSLAGLTARLLDLVRRGPAAVRHPREALALGRVYAQGGLDSRAREAYQHACAQASIASIRIAGLRSLALLSRRSRRYDDAATYWCQLLDVPACPAPLAREATQALAVHHEHRARDLAAAKAFALRCFDAQKPAWNQAVQYRLARIERKINNSQRSSLNFESASSGRVER
ncbi:MAG TPA: ribonuclease H-like domain-containing protein [Vicinamibacterales bacterium]